MCEIAITRERRSLESSYGSVAQNGADERRS